jgi:tripartite-type tricarboxylate transporter receptor subunit TctC
MKTTVFVAAFAAAFAAAAVPLSAGAQSFPSKPIRFVVGFPPGGATDNVARAIAPKMGEFLGQPVVVENNGGAAGLAASIQVARSAPDGHTILLATTGGHLLRPLLQQQLPVDSFRDFTPITQLIESVFANAPGTVPLIPLDNSGRARSICVTTASATASAVTELGGGQQAPDPIT